MGPGPGPHPTEQKSRHPRGKGASALDPSSLNRVCLFVKGGMYICIGVGALLTNGSLAWLKTQVSPVSKGKNLCKTQEEALHLWVTVLILG